MAKAAIVYVGTADGLATYSDPGNTGRWRRVGHTLEGRAVQAILAADAATLIVAVAGEAPLASTDGGQTWSTAPSAEADSLCAFLEAEGPLVTTAHGPAHWKGDHAPAPGAVALALLAGRQEVLIAAIAGGTAIVRSEDGGATWAQATIDGALRGGVTTIVPASYHIDYAWAGTDAGQLLRSEDRGRTWREVGNEPAPIHCLAVVRLESSS
ncbi:MAG: sialidase family protein [Chloroflexi bacterium OHK40]